MKQIFEDLIPLTKKLGADWSPFLLKFNIEKPVTPLYETYDLETANILLAYILLAYLKDSPWLNVRKERSENKTTILNTLLGKKREIQEPFISLLEKPDPVVAEVIEWALLLQQDWRIAQMEAYRSYHAAMLSVYKKNMGENMDDNLKIARNMEEGIKAREKADELQAAFDKEFAGLDQALEREGHAKLSEIPSNQLTWEQYITLRKLDQKQEREPE